MEVAKRIVNLIYAILIIAFVVMDSMFSIRFDWVWWVRVIGVVSLIFGVINFALFKKFTVWNK